ncbi:MAG TPA: hypothetical protein VFE53_06265 [Mucilaginibacter sp.]|jgi:hypothetical protein|nr:hypothetical protein [Mucilaginibacter sp.]
MKNLTLSLAALTVFVIMITSSCNSSSSKLDKFIGKWTRIEKAKRDTLTIEKEYDAAVVSMGKNKVAAVYDKDKNILKIYFLANTMIVSYVEKTDHIIGPGNSDKTGEYKRVK